jgi:acyl-coenzyme A thioesterase PaaI-like protein
MNLTSALSIAEDYQRLSGIEFIRKLMRDGTESPMGELLNMTVVSVADGEVAIRGVPDEKFYNPMLRVHGGWTAALIDTALG